MLWRSLVVSIRDEVSIEVDVVFICPPQPRHAEGIQDVSEDQRGASWNSRETIQQRQLDGGPGKTFDTVNSRGMDERLRRGFFPDPADVDGEVVA